MVLTPHVFPTCLRGLQENLDWDDLLRGGGGAASLLGMAMCSLM